MKLYPNILTGITDCLKAIFEEQKYTDDVLEKAFKNHRQWGSRDRRFIAEAVYECVRWWRKFAYAAQIATDDVVLADQVLAVYLISQGIDLPEWFSPLSLPAETITSKLNNAQLKKSILHSIPDWLYETGNRELGEKWEQEIHALNGPSQVILRVNTLKTSKPAILEQLQEKNIPVSELPGYPDALLLQKRQSLASLEEYKEGLIEVQDAGSQSIAPFLDVSPGTTVIDACAGGGGKSLHLAALMQNKGKIFSLDIFPRKLEALKIRANRAGTNMIETGLASEEYVAAHLNLADRLLLDVPCSGLGVLKRNPDTKWKLSADELKKTRGLQQHLLHSYERTLKPGGLLVYATCSILPSENQEQIRLFLTNNPQKYQLVKEKQVWPSEGFDGFYMACLKKMF